MVGIIGIIIWLIGFYFESVGDKQLKEFKSKSENKGKIMTEIHQNYAFIAQRNFAERARLLVLHSSADGRIGPEATSL